MLGRGKKALALSIAKLTQNSQTLHLTVDYQNQLAGGLRRSSLTLPYMLPRLLANVFHVENSQDNGQPSFFTCRNIGPVFPVGAQGSKLSLVATKMTLLERWIIGIFQEEAEHQYLEVKVYYPSLLNKTI